MFDLLSLLTSDLIDQAVGNHVLKTIDNGLNCNWGLLSFRHLKIKYEKHSTLLCVSDFSFCVSRHFCESTTQQTMVGHCLLPV